MRIDRLLEIILLLLGQDMVTGKQMAERFGVSVRTIQRDITTLCMAGIPIVADAGCNGGYSILNSYKLQNDFVKKEDFNLIIMALKSLSTSYENNRLNLILDKYLSLSGIRQTSVLLDYGVTREGDKIQERNGLLESCIEQRHRITFRYRDTYGNRTERTVHPLILHFKWYAWYLFAFDTVRQDYRTFKVVRMEDVAEDGRTFSEVADAGERFKKQEQDYYRTCEHILVWCRAEHLGLLEENFPAASFARQKDGSWIMDLHVPPAEPMWQALLLGLGDCVRILSPRHYREQLIRTAKKFISNYDT